MVVVQLRFIRKQVRVLTVALRAGLRDNTYVTLWLVILVNHNVTSVFLLSIFTSFFVILYTCDIMIGQCHQP